MAPASVRAARGANGLRCCRVALAHSQLTRCPRVQSYAPAAATAVWSRRKSRVLLSIQIKQQCDQSDSQGMALAWAFRATSHGVFGGMFGGAQKKRIAGKCFLKVKPFRDFFLSSSCNDNVNGTKKGCTRLPGPCQCSACPCAQACPWPTAGNPIRTLHEPPGAQIDMRTTTREEPP